MIYKINIKKLALKFINAQDKIQQVRLYKAIYNLPAGDIKKMQIYYNKYRLRVGKYRIIFEQNDKDIIINVIDVDNRGDIYKIY